MIEHNLLFAFESLFDAGTHQKTEVVALFATSYGQLSVRYGDNGQLYARVSYVEFDIVVLTVQRVIVALERGGGTAEQDFGVVQRGHHQGCFAGIIGWRFVALFV